MRKTSGVATAGLILAGLFGTVSSLAQDAVPQGITDPVVLAPFVPSEQLCSAPPDLDRSLTFVQDNEREFIQGVSFGLSRAAGDRGLPYASLIADDSATRMAEQVQSLIAKQAGAVVVAPVDPRSLAPGLQTLIDHGAYVGAVVPPPAVTILNAPQYLTGQVLAEAAARYIVDELGGQAKVILLTHDSLQFLAPRFRAMRDVLGKLPGVTIVADISPTPVSEEGGYATMKTILLAQPDIDVVLGADTVVLGALRALEETGNAQPDQFLGGIDGEPDAVAEILKDDSPYKATVSLASPIFGYALGQYAADWMEGRTVPQAMDVLPYLLTPENIAQYREDLADPAAVWTDPDRRGAYLRMYGSICYDTRSNYLNFPWSSEG
jgi:ribose transport system substrate-binding protein